MTVLSFCLLGISLFSQDELRDLERLAGQLERRIGELEASLEKDRNWKLSEELARARKELEGVRRELRALQGERDSRGQRERELKELIEEIEKALDQERNEERRQLLKEDLSLARRELEELRGKASHAGRRPPKGPPPPEGMRIAELEGQSLKLAGRVLAERDRKERTRLREELRSLLGRLFDMKEAARRREIEELAKQVEELKAQLKRRQEGRDTIIEARLRQLLGEQEGWDW